MKRKRLFIPVMLGTALSVVSTLCEAESKHIHVTAQVTQQKFIGDPASPQLGDWILTNVDLFDDSGTRVGTGGHLVRSSASHPGTRSRSASLRWYLPRGRSFLGVWPRCPRSEPRRGSAFWAAQTTFVKPAGRDARRDHQRDH